MKSYKSNEDICPEGSGSHLRPITTGEGIIRSAFYKPHLASAEEWTGERRPEGRQDDQLGVAAWPNEGKWTNSRKLEEVESTGSGDTLEMGQREEFRMALGFSVGTVSE